MISRKKDHILQTIPFNSRRKRAATCLRHPDDQKRVRVFLKGAPEIVIDYCANFLDTNGAPE